MHASATPLASLSSFPGGVAAFSFESEHECQPGALCLDAVGRELPDAIAQLIKKREALTDDAADEVGRALLSLADGVGREIEALASGDDARDRILRLTLADALDILDDITDASGAPILDGARETWAARLQELADLALRTSDASGVSGLDVEAFAAIQNAGLENAASAWDTKVKRILGDAVLRAANEALYARPSIVGQVISRMVEDLTPALVTEARTATAVYDRFVSAQTAIAADPEGTALRWLYVGPVDGLQRPFCRAVTGKAWTIDQVGRLRNGQSGQPVAEFGGGYNCRHGWVQMTAETAKRRGYDEASELELVAANLAPLKRGRR